jgi:hypothetical protein
MRNTKNSTLVLHFVFAESIKTRLQTLEKGVTSIHNRVTATRVTRSVQHRLRWCRYPRSQNHPRRLRYDSMLQPARDDHSDLGKRQRRHGCTRRRRPTAADHCCSRSHNRTKQSGLHPGCRKPGSKIPGRTWPDNSRDPAAGGRFTSLLLIAQRVSPQGFGSRRVPLAVPEQPRKGSTLALKTVCWR